jgi:diguanylate cyclase (GGDEF)-like protein
MNPPQLDAFVRAWARSLHATRFVPMTTDERHALLRRMAERLAGQVAAATLDPTVAYQVGVDLVRAEYAVPECLGATVAVVHSRLLEDLGLDPGRHRERLTGVLAALANGFARAAHDATLDGQEAIRHAALTARERAERALRANEIRFRDAALHDSLTGLANRMQFMEWVTEAVTGAAAGARLGLCRIDLHGFTAINDSLGYGVGDRVLVAVADRLDGLAAAGGQRLARLDGDRFALLITGTETAEDVTKLADRALALIAAPVEIDGNELPLSGVAGVVERPAAGADPAELLRAAEIALRWSTVDGGAGWSVFEHARSERDVARYRISAAMPAALSRGEFTLVYQPLVTLADGTLAGVEALARWHHPELGVLGPDRFIGLAEDTGLIVPLGLALLEQACHQAAAWRAGNRRAPYVSVNLAVRQLRQPGLVASVAEILDRTGLPASGLQLEITESAAIGPGQSGLPVLRDLAGLGVRIAIDDFGTGYSNLASLDVWPLHGLKLAARFAAHPYAGDPAKRDAFLRAVVAFSGHLGIAVTAEGIETPDQAQRLRSIGCTTGQGWHFGRPVPAEQISRQLAA